MKINLFLVVDNKEHGVGLIHATTIKNARAILRRLKEERKELRGTHIYVVKKGKR